MAAVFHTSLSGLLSSTTLLEKSLCTSARAEANLGMIVPLGSPGVESLYHPIAHTNGTPCSGCNSLHRVDPTHEHYTFVNIEKGKFLAYRT